MPKANHPFWNPLIETLPREKLLQIEIKNFRNIFAYAKEHAPYAREKYRGLSPEDIKTIEDIRSLPIMDKEDLRAAQAGKNPFPFGEILGVNIKEISGFRQTSGTTGRPVYVPESYESWQWRIEVWCHILWMAGFRETDRVFVPFGYNVYVAFWEGHYAAEKLGCMVIPGGALDTKGRIHKMLEVKATALLNTPTYGLHMAETAQKMGIEPKEIGIKKMICAGEPLPPATREMLEDLWGAKVLNHIGGTEPCGWASMCEERCGLHVIEPFFLVEILDMETLSQEVQVGQLGIAVVTPLGRRSFPIIRFNTKDIVKRGQDGCLCGRTSMTLSEVVGRLRDLKKIRGVLFTPVSVEELLRKEFPMIGEYEIIVTKKGVMDEISLKMELREKVSADFLTKLKHDIGERLKTKTNLRFNIGVAKPGELPRYTLKSKRFKDLRQIGISS